ncbi:hypothetical protein ACCO45_004616 [Purpureocillium lilacinum]|uniref:Uncharacterized protein n=1 Tax=Purpureocillium lilacinum TaxID=33203 RepID=A0ACC4DUD1_PURLI
MAATTSIRAGASYLESLFGLAGRVAVVTGGSSGIARRRARFRPALDVRDADAITTAVLRDHGVPDILVNAAGINPRPHMDTITLKDWEETIAVNLTAPFALGQKFGPAMAQRGSGRIVNVVSQQAFRAFGNSGAYGASKGGLVSLTRSQAEAWNGVPEDFAGIAVYLASEASRAERLPRRNDRPTWWFSKR